MKWWKDSWGHRERAKARSLTVHFNDPTAYKSLHPVPLIHFTQWFFHTKCIICSCCKKQNGKEAQGQAPHCFFPFSGFLKSSVFSASWLQPWAEVLKGNSHSHLISGHVLGCWAVGLNTFRPIWASLPWWLLQSQGLKFLRSKKEGAVSILYGTAKKST